MVFSADPALQTELDDFIVYLSEDTFQLKPVVTVMIDTEDDHYDIGFRNAIPSGCSGLIGATKRDSFTIYFTARGEYRSFVKVLYPYICSLEDRTSDIPAIALEVQAGDVIT